MFAILGATGKVGREVVGLLSQVKQPVRAIVRDLAAYAGEAEAREADIRDAGALTRAIAGAHTVHVIIPTGSPKQDVPAEMRRAMGAVVEALAAAKPARVLAVSDYGAHLRRGTGMAELFHELEQRLSALPSDLVVLRSAEHMENWGRMAGAVKEGAVLPSMHHPVGTPFPSVSARDVGRIAGELLLGPWRPGRRIVHVEGPRRISAEDVASAFGVLLGRKVTAVPVPRTEWLSRLAATGMSEQTALAIADTFVASNAGIIDVDPLQPEVVRGRTEIADALRSLAM